MKTLFHRFKARGWQLLEPQERSDWGLVFAMQHIMEYPLAWWIGPKISFALSTLLNEEGLKPMTPRFSFSILKN